MNSKSTSKVDSFKNMKNLGLGYFKQNFLIEYVFIKLGYKDHYIFLILRLKTHVLSICSNLLPFYFTCILH
jgi:hypothetical protein